MHSVAVVIMVTVYDNCFSAACSNLFLMLLCYSTCYLFLQRTFVQTNSLDNGQVSSKKICSEDSSQMFCSEDCAQLINSEDSVLVLNKELCNGNLQRDMGIKSTKHLKRPVVNLFFGSKQLLLGSLKPRKRRKHKRIKRQLKSSIDAESIASDQHTSTSENCSCSGYIMYIP
jgi:ubiquitin carboxyl-terminal hydrolase 36/42